jgi:formate dehydrogenase subunit delta
VKTIEKLVMMANQIAANLAREPDPAGATAEHIRLFWAPAMKAALIRHGSEGLSETAVEALDRLSV